MRLTAGTVALITLFSLLFTGEAFCAVSNDIRVNMEGYRENDRKFVILVNQNYSSFTVRRVSDNVSVFTGNFAAAINDAASGDICRIGEFSSVTAPGEYYVQVAGLGESVNFRVGWDVFNNVFIWAMRGFYSQRCGQAVSLTHRGNTFSHPACHTANASFGTGTGMSGTRDVTGGWHDAGDYGKYVLNSNITMAQLLMMFNRYSSIIGGVTFGLPYSGGAMPDTLVEIKYNLDFMLKMQHTNGGLFHKVAGYSWPGMDVMPQNDTQTQYIRVISSCATGGFAAVMALASRIYQPYDANFAATCLAAAQNAWTWLQNNPSIVPAGGFTDTAGSGAYPDTDDRDERLWAAVELFNTTGSAVYNTYVQSNYLARPLTTMSDNGDDWKELHPIAYISYIQSPQASAITTVQNTMRTAFQSHVNVFRTRINSTNGYRYVLEPGDYYWGSNSVGLNRAMRLLVAADIFNDMTYRDAAFETVHYMLGRNPYNKSFMTYVGEVYTSNPHHRPSVGDGVVPPWPGLLAGGSNEYHDTGTAPAKSYHDVDGNYTSNEIAINWQAAFCYVLAAMVSPLPPTATPTSTITGTPPTPTITRTPTVTPTFMAIRVNCAGPQFTGEGALVWAADRAYTVGSWGFTTAGNTNTRAVAIANTTDDTLFHTERWNATLGYSFDIANGTYQVRMRFADTFSGTAFVGARRFNVSLEGLQVLTNFDIFAEVGANAAVDRTFIVTVSDGQLNISLTQGAADMPLINAIEVITYFPPATPTFTLTRTHTSSPTRTRTPTASPTPTPTITGTPPTITNTPTFTATATPMPVRINCGGPNYTDGSGNLWSADINFSGGTAGSTADAIAGTTDDTLYQTERYGNSSYSIPVTSGEYQVTLKFCEIFFTSAGSRSFNVLIEGTQVITGLDLFVVAGSDTAHDRVFTTVVSDGILNINFVSVTDNATISAIQVLPVFPTPTPTSTRTSVVSPTFTATRTPTRTPTATITATLTHLPTLTFTATVFWSQTSTETRTATPTEIIMPSATATGTTTGTRTPAATATHTFTATGTYTRTMTATPSNTATNTPTRSPTMTVTRTHTASPTATVSPTATLSPTGTPPTLTVTTTITLSHTASRTETNTPTPSETATMTFTATGTRSATLTATETATPEDTPENTPTMSATATPDFSPTITRTITETPTGTPPTPTITDTVTSTATITSTPSQTPVNTATVTPTHTASWTDTLTVTATVTVTVTASPSRTANIIPVITPTPTASPQPVPGSGKLEIISKMIYPNPYKISDGRVRIMLELEGDADSSVIRVFTQAFRLVIKEELGRQYHGIHSRDYDLPGLRMLSPGVYYYVIECRGDENKSASSGVGKLVIQR